MAAPATVETICVTRAYKVARRYSLLSPLLHPRRPRGLGARTATSPDSGDECAASAKRLAFRVVAVEYGAILLTLLTLIISAYSLSGRMILDSQRQILADYAAIGQDMEEFAKDMPATAAPAGDASLPAAALCDGATPNLATPVQKVELVVQSGAAAGGKAALPPSDSAHFTVLGLHRCSLYWRSKHATEDIAAVTLHLVSWTRVVVGLPNIGNVFGVSEAFIRESADMHSEWCKRLGLELGHRRALSPGEIADLGNREIDVRAEFVANASPDGHTLIFVNSAHAILKFLNKSLPFDPVHDFAGVSIEIARRIRSDFDPKEMVDPDRIEGLDDLIEESIRFKYIAAPLTQAQIKELIQIPR